MKQVSYCGHHGCSCRPRRDRGARRPGGAPARPNRGRVVDDRRQHGKLTVTRALGDDGLLRAVIGEVEREGFTVVGPDDILAALVASTRVWWPMPSA